MKHIFIPLFLFIHFGLNAQSLSVTVNVESAGTLSIKIAESKKYEITDLTITGNLSGYDIKYIRDLCQFNNDVELTTKGKLTNLNIKGVTFVSDNPFYAQYYYGNNFIDNANAICRYLFTSCALKSIVLPDNINRIGGGAFSSCKLLEYVSIPNSVTDIEMGAFGYCSLLKSLTISEFVKSIGVNCFVGCVSMKEIIVSSSNPFFNSNNGVLFNKDMTNLVYFPNSNSTTFLIPSSVSKINESAFEYCPSLTKITIPNTVKTIGKQAFFNCASLMEIHCNATNLPVFDYDVYDRVTLESVFCLGI